MCNTCCMTTTRPGACHYKSFRRTLRVTTIGHLNSIGIRDMQSGLNSSSPLNRSSPNTQPCLC
jgi:hypothetical protein